MRKIILVLVVGVLIACAAIAFFALSGDGGDSTASVVDGGTAEPTVTPLPAPTFDELHESLSTMTEAQWEYYASNDLVGMYVDGWQGTIYDVNQTLGFYQVVVDIQDDSQIRVEVSEEDALTFEKDQPVTVSGEIDNVSWILGLITLTLDDNSVISK